MERISFGLKMNTCEGYTFLPLHASLPVSLGLLVNNFLQCIRFSECSYMAGAVGAIHFIPQQYRSDFAHRCFRSERRTFLVRGCHGAIAAPLGAAASAMITS
ncbi:hypothetical protein LE191_03555 [Janthinobacterium sp. HSC-3S05]|uniref:hypothetical protein n=1 Tax=Janthinobacterium lividum TaxID=29581 RepID=UPI001CD91357|nr:hypothetical protein [Janthinobacterium lividum]MCA1859188.1 hypothetical protein [Janthinobacterium lividum]